MKIPLHDILAELGVGEKTSAEELRKIPHEKFVEAAEKIAQRVKNEKPSR